MSDKHRSKANPEATVVHGKARFTVLTDSMIRMEYSENARFTDDPSLVFVIRYLPVPSFTHKVENKQAVIRTDRLELRYRIGSGAFDAANLKIKLMNFLPRTVWKPGLQDTRNLMGTTRTLDETNGAADVKLEKGILSRSGWALIDDTRTPLLDDTDWQWVKARGGKQVVDWYFFAYGHRYLDALRDYCRVSGSIPMPPRFAFGYWWSRYWAYSDEELRALVTEFERHRLPLDVLVIDMDWHETHGLSRRDPQIDTQGEMIGWGGYTWNRDLFPDPRRFLEFLRDRGIKVAMNLHPASGITKDEEHYEDFALAYKKKPAKDRTYHYAMEERRWAEAFFSTIIKPLEDDGVDFWWLDWQAWEQSRQVPGLSNIWWLNHVFFNHSRRKGGSRPLLFHRWGGLGNHRYQIGFSGDTWISWKSLANLPAFTATAGNVCYAYWSHDIGGHMGEPGSPELYLRWLQYGVFSPILRTHATKDKDLERRFWRFPEHYASMREALLLRHSLTPYIYNAARRAFEDGISVCRPLYWLHPKRDQAYQHPNTYYFGDDIIVAPITSPMDESGLSYRSVWLPPGQWYDVCHGGQIEGGDHKNLEYAAGEIPWFVRPGAIIPLLPENQAVGRPTDHYVLDIYPGSDGETSLYEDDCCTDAYRDGAFARTRIDQKTCSGKLTVTIHPTQGQYEDMPGKLAFRLNLIGRFPPKQVLFNGQALSYAAEPILGHWSYEPARLAIVIMLPPTSRQKAHVCSVAFTARAEAGLKLLNGIPGVLKRIPEAMRVLKNEMNRFDPIANLPSEILNLAGTSSRLFYNPKGSWEELTSFPHRLKLALGRVLDLEGGDHIALARVIRMLSLRRIVAPSPRIVVKSVGNQTTVDMRCADPDVSIRYTIDATMPDQHSTLFRKPVQFSKMAVITARTFVPGCLPGMPVSALVHYNWAKRIGYGNPCSPKYDGGGQRALVNGTLGNKFDHLRNWVGFEGSDAVLEIELTRPMELRSIILRFLRDQSKWIFYPRFVVIEISADGQEYETAFRRNLQKQSYFPDTSPDILTLNAVMKIRARARFVRVVAGNIGSCPAWHPGSGGKAWVFMDEILIAEG